jgi:hydroxypyruvate isomerase
MFTEYSFLDRFEEAARQGFSLVEYLFPYEYEPGVLAEKLRQHGLSQVLFNLPPGDWTAGERGMSCIPGREMEFSESVDKAIVYAKALSCPLVHAMAGNCPLGVNNSRLQDTYLKNIGLAGRRLAEEGLELCIEPINRYSMPEYFLRTQEQAVEVIETIDLPNIKLQFDFFHCQMQEGNITNKFRRYFSYIAHCQLAGVPDRHEPDQSELYYPYLFELLDSMGYMGAIGCEYNPAEETVAGLAWIRKFGVIPPS